jgi:Leucine-rich repeat (LRR) protein
MNILQRLSLISMALFVCNCITVDAEPVPKTCWAERLDSKQYLTNWTEIVANGNMITSLRLDKNELHVVPPEVFGMTNLIWLDLDFNHLMEFMFRTINSQKSRHGSMCLRN